MNPRPIISADGAWSFDPDDLIACGYQSTGRRFPDGHVGIGRVESLARELDVTMSSLALFRTGAVGTDVEWEYFYTPDWKPGFCGSPLLPKW
jgi:hypothetical protein